MTAEETIKKLGVTSDYSNVCCLNCGMMIRTKAQYVAILPNMTPTQRDIFFKS